MRHDEERICLRDRWIQFMSQATVIASHEDKDVFDELVADTLTHLEQPTGPETKSIEGEPPE